MASSDDSVPRISDMDSPGSSVSSSLQREYEELLKYAVVTPKIQVCPNVYEQNKSAKDEAAPSRSTLCTETNSSGGSSTSGTSSVTTQSSVSQEVAHAASADDVRHLPSTPSQKVSFQGQGSLARDSLLRDGNYNVDHLASNHSQNGANTRISDERL